MKLLPLSPIRFHILLALAAEPASASLIASRIVHDSFGELEPSPATLHDNLMHLLARHWIEPTAARRYRLTEIGRQFLQSDLYRWRIVTSRATDMLRRA